MEICITYRSFIFIKGDSLSEIKKAMEELDLDPIDESDPRITDFGFLEVESAVDEKGRDFTSEFDLQL